MITRHLVDKQYLIKWPNIAGFTWQGHGLKFKPTTVIQLIVYRSTTDVGVYLSLQNSEKPTKRSIRLWEFKKEWIDPETIWVPLSVLEEALKNDTGMDVYATAIAYILSKGRARFSMNLKQARSVEVVFRVLGREMREHLSYEDIHPFITSK